MHKHLIAMITLFSATQLAAADGDPQGELANLAGTLENAWHIDDGAWVLQALAIGNPETDEAACTKSLAVLRTANVPDTATLTLRSDTRDLKSGTHTIAEARHACELIEHMRWIAAFDGMAVLVQLDPTVSTAQQCIDAYDRAIKAGIAPAERIPERMKSIDGKRVKWAGSIEELRIKHCDPTLKAAKEEQAKKQAPYRKVLKNDKLAMQLATPVPYTVLGGNSTWDPGELAASPVWFDALSDQTGQETCPGGVKRRTLRRYAFDKQHKLVNTTHKDYCGTIPQSAFR